MFGLLLLLFLVVPLVELYIIIRIAGWLDVWATIGLLVFNSVVGAWLVRREGLGVIRRIQSQLRSGTAPTSGLVDGLLIAFAGALLLTPGFLTDLLGFSQLFPPTRAIVRKILISRYRGRIKEAAIGGIGSRIGGDPSSGFSGVGFGWPPGEPGPRTSAWGTASPSGPRSRFDDIVDAEVVDDRYTDEPPTGHNEIS